MSSKRESGAKHVARSAAGPVWRQSADEATLAQNPRYNGFACGHGAHGDRKFNRAKANRAWKAQLRQEGASRGSFPFSAAMVLSGRACDMLRRQCKVLRFSPNALGKLAAQGKVSSLLRERRSKLLQMKDASGVYSA